MSQRQHDDDIAPPPSGWRRGEGGHLPSPTSHLPHLPPEESGEGRAEKGEGKGGRRLRDWLEPRASGVPARLVARMRTAFEQLDAESEETPAALGSAALMCLRDALAKGDRREAALDLLAADALLTYGCEAAAEAGPGALERFANDYGAPRLAALLSAASPPSGARQRGGPNVGGQQDRRSAATSPAANSVAQHLRNLARTAEAVAGELAGPIADVAEHVTRTFDGGGKLLFCGNGGSAADAQHLATEYVVRFRSTRRPLPAIALTTDTSLLTAASNDLGFDQVFARQVHALARVGDLLFLDRKSVV